MPRLDCNKLNVLLINSKRHSHLESSNQSCWHFYVSHDLTLWPTRGNGSSDTTAIVIVSLPGCALCFAFFIERTWSLHLCLCAASLRGWIGGGEGESQCVKWVRDRKSLPSVYAAAAATASKGTRTASPQTYWFISHPGYVFCAAKTCSFWLPPALRRVVQVEPTASPPEGGEKTDVAARVAARVLVVIAREPVNHTISAQMPLGQQLPATAIKCRWYRWPNSSLPFYRLSAPRAQIMSYIGRHWIPACDLFQRHVLNRTALTVVMNAVIGYSFIAAVWCRATQEHPNPGFHQLCLILSSSLITYLHNGQSILSVFPSGPTMLILLVTKIMDCAGLIQRWNSVDVALTELQLWRLSSRTKANRVSHAVSTPFPLGFSRHRGLLTLLVFSRNLSTEDVWHDALSSPSRWQTHIAMAGLSNSRVGRRGTHQSQCLCVWYVLSLFCAARSESSITVWVSSWQRRWSWKAALKLSLPSGIYCST